MFVPCHPKGINALDRMTRWTIYNLFVCPMKIFTMEEVWIGSSNKRIMIWSALIPWTLWPSWSIPIPEVSSWTTLTYWSYLWSSIDSCPFTHKNCHQKMSILRNIRHNQSLISNASDNKQFNKGYVHVHEFDKICILLHSSEHKSC